MTFSFSDPFAKRIIAFGMQPFVGPKEALERDGFWKNGLLEIASDGPPTYASTNRNTMLAIQLLK